MVDATGVGAGLASVLGQALPGRVLPFIFSSASKSRLGWDFLSIVETGRFKDWAAGDELQAAFQAQLAYCQMEVLPGPERRRRWGVPDGLRHPASGQPVHDDLLLSAALCAVLEGQPWGLAESQVIPGADPLDGLRETF